MGLVGHCLLKQVSQIGQHLHHRFGVGGAGVQQVAFNRAGRLSIGARQRLHPLTVGTPLAFALPTAGDELKWVSHGFLLFEAVLSGRTGKSRCPRSPPAGCVQPDSRCRPFAVAPFRRELCPRPPGPAAQCGPGARRWFPQPGR
ncbi:hypothetical protein SDC9_198956 [bioreactor metagenome]|uniref:Uncharacterized protein n=1 Tax=bioreactor metagenome TaxID=1076179 RepID=A0A645IVV1_9ZZZZ